MIYRTLATTILLLTLSVFTGCADKKKELEPRPDTRPMVNAIQQAEQDWAWITGLEWYLVTMESKAPIAGTMLRISFKEHTWLEGDAGCNRFTSSYTRKADSGLKLGEILSTRMYCAQPEGLMQQESRFFHLLTQVDAYHAEPDRLDLLIDGSVALSFTILSEEETP